MFVDNSGSTGNSANYWSAVNDVIYKYAKNISHYYLWNSDIKEVPLKQLEAWVTSKKGTGGTSPNVVAQEVVSKKYKEIILVTDGEVGDGSVQMCDKIFDEAEKNQNFKYDKSICFIISTGYGELNMSVTCPFTRNCESQVYTKRKDE